jgi:hypothetical protein
MTGKQLLREPNFWIGVAIAAVVIPVLIYAIIRYEREPITEADFQVVSLVPTTRGRAELRPKYHHEKCLWTTVGDKTVRADLLMKATVMWNDRVCEGKSGCQYVCNQNDPDLFFRTGEKSEARFGNIFVMAEVLPDNGEGGVTNNVYDVKMGEAYYAVVKINKMHTYHEDSYIAALVHEVGHGLLLGHCDDRHETSIMRKRLNVRGTITDHDAELLRKAWNSQ